MVRSYPGQFLLAYVMLALLLAPSARAQDDQPQEIDRWIAQLDAPRLAARQQAEDELIKIGVPALASLAKARQSENVEIRLRSAAIAARINELRIAEADVHAVGIYEAGSPDSRVVVRIESARRPVVLVVCARDTVRWEIQLGRKVELIKVIASGHLPQKVLGTDVAVQHFSTEGDVPPGVRDKAFYAYLKPSIRYDEMCQRIKELTGKELSSFQCRYDGGGKPFVIGEQ